jgi:hypothetical protein
MCSGIPALGIPLTCFVRCALNGLQRPIDLVASIASAGFHSGGTLLLDLADCDNFLKSQKTNIRPEDNILTLFARCSV